MKVVLVAVVFTVLGFYFGKEIRKHSALLYILAVIVSIGSFFFVDQIKIMEMFVHGYVGLGFLFIIMFTGALKKKSILSKKLVSIRKEYSILGFIFIIPHATNYVIELFSDFTQIEYWIGIIAFAIMIPLFVTSFSKFRNLFKYPAWKKLHRWSYLAYILIFIHIILVAELRGVIVYTVIFTPYLVMKLLKEHKLYIAKKEKEAVKKLNI